MMTKYMDQLQRFGQWIVLGAMMLAYFAYLILTPSVSIQQTLMDWQTWVHTAFVISLNVGMVSISYDTATVHGTSLEEFIEANKLNNKIITTYNNNKDAFREYVKSLNTHERLTLQEDFLYAIGNKSFEEMTWRQKWRFRRLKPIYHDIFGYNLPLYYEATKDGRVDYKASIAQNEGKRKRQLTKGFMGIIFSAMTVNMTVTFDNIGSALFSLFIIAAGLLITFVMIYVPHLNRFKRTLPNKVLAKATLLNGFLKYIKGEMILITESKLIDNPQPAA